MLQCVANKLQTFSGADCKNYTILVCFVRIEVLTMKEPDKTLQFPTNNESESKTSKYLAVVDDATGKVKGYFPLTPKSLSEGGDFLAMYQSSLAYISTQKELTGETLRVFLKLLSCLDFDNYLTVSQSQIAKEIGIPRPNVTKSIKKLLESDIIREGARAGLNKTYRLNPAVGHKGKNYKDTVIEFSRLESKRKQKQIDFETGEILN